MLMIFFRIAWGNWMGLTLMFMSLSEINQDTDQGRERLRPICWESVMWT